MLIANIEDLRRTIKVNATLPFETVEPYIAYATTHYLQRYIGKPLYLSMVDYVKGDVPAADNVPMDELLELCKQAIGPLAVALGTDELSIMIGDSGHTVSKSETKTPASDAKILLAKESALKRGFDAIERVIVFLEENSDSFPLWEQAPYRKNASCVFLKNAQEFQSMGFVDISYSRLTYEKFTPLLLSLEYSLESWLPAGVAKLLASVVNGNPTPEQKQVIRSLRVWMANKVAQIHTSKTTREQRSAPGALEFKALIRPVYSDGADNGNFYEEQADRAFSDALQVINSNAAQFGIDTLAPAAEFNKIENKIFVV